MQVAVGIGESRNSPRFAEAPTFRTIQRTHRKRAAAAWGYSRGPNVETPSSFHSRVTLWNSFHPAGFRAAHSIAYAFPPLRVQNFWISQVQLL